ncbi:MAG: amidophosphoribosyltransferase [Planctomycetota bacterium]
MSQNPREACGIVGVYNVPEAAAMTYLGLHALQHRGQESAGIVTSDGRNIRSRKGMGLLSGIFSTEDIRRLPGHAGIGHVRYSTAGGSKPQNTQPLVMEYSEGLIAIAHNGNLTNAKQIRDEYEAYGSIFQTSTDSEVVVHLMAKPTHVAKRNNIGHCLGSHIKGAYSFLFMTRTKLMAARDPQGFRPLCLGRKGEGYILASETCAFDQMGARFEREVEPGEFVIIDEQGLRSESFVPEDLIRPAHCIFEHVYFARPDSTIFGDNVHLVRKRLGVNLAREHPADADVVVPVPDGGNSAAIGYAQASGIPLDRGLIRNHYVGRTFLNPVQSGRDRAVHLKHNVVKDVVRGKRVVLVDDSLVRGTTMKRLVRAVRDGGASEVHLRISCPPNAYPCYYGVDFPTRGELIAANSSREEIERALQVESLRYISIEGLLDATSGPSGNYCTACFSGKYPLPASEELGNKMRMEAEGEGLVLEETAGG